MLVGRKTPVWRYDNTDQIVCGPTIQDALGVGYMFAVSPKWQQVSVLPRGLRVVIVDGHVLPRNTLTCAIAEEATEKGSLTVFANNRMHQFKVFYVDPVKVIVGL